jgi:hypothetical protein
VAASIKYVLDNDKARSEVIIAKLPEKKQDTQDIDKLCADLNLSSRPTAITRLGKKEGQHHLRLTKVTFATPFDARKFLAKVDEVQRSDAETDDDDSTAKSIRCRPCRNFEEQKRHKCSRRHVKKLNGDSRAAGVEDESFSLRQNGDIWKFKKMSNGKWTRVRDWVAPSFTDEMPVSGNGATTPKSPGPM